MSGSTDEKRPVIGVLGAGPKAMALVTKCEALRRKGIKTPKIRIFERNEIGANWTGRHGFTDGSQLLGTSPEKDLGFPYASTVYDGHNKSINQTMFSFSWAQFLNSKGEYAHWIDSGRPQPTHSEWAEYLNWAYRQCDGTDEVIITEVTSISNDDSKWVVSTKNKTDSSTEYLLDGLVVTGPGTQSMDHLLQKTDFVISSANPDLVKVQQNLPKKARVAIVGVGESSAYATSLFLNNTNFMIDIISPSGVIFSRGEGIFENGFYSNVDNTQWKSISWKDRKNFISRTDRGVYSVAILRDLCQRHNINIITGSLVDISQNMNDRKAELILRNNGLHFNAKNKYDLVVLSTGFDCVHKFKKLLTVKASEKIEEEMGVQSLSTANLEALIQSDLSLKGLSSRLHLPMIAGPSQGPGFSNLSCLGLLSDKIIGSYIEGRIQ